MVSVGELVILFLNLLLFLLLDRSQCSSMEAKPTTVVTVFFLYNDDETLPLLCFVPFTLRLCLNEYVVYSFMMHSPSRSSNTKTRYKIFLSWCFIFCRITRTETHQQKSAIGGENKKLANSQNFGSLPLSTSAKRKDDEQT